MKLLFTIICTAVLTTVIAQPPAGSFNKQGNGQNMNIGHIYGKVVDSSTNKGIEAASIQLIGHKFDSTTKKMKDAIIATLITEKNGDFSIENLSMFGNYQLHISAVGFTDYNKPVSFGIKRPQGGAAGADNSSQQDRAQQMLGM